MTSVCLEKVSSKQPRTSKGKDDNVADVRNAQVSKKKAKGFKKGAYYHAIPFLKEWLSQFQNLEKELLHITLEFSKYELKNVGKLHIIQIVGIFDQELDTDFQINEKETIPKGRWKSIICKVDDKLYREDGKPYHITICNAGSAKYSGDLCKMALDEKNELFTYTRPSESKPFYGISTLIKKRDNLPIPVYIDIDGTMFLPINDLPKNKGKIDWDKFKNDYEWTMNNMKPLPFCCVFNQFPLDSLTVITNRRTDNPKDMTKAFNDLVSRSLNREIVFEIDFEQENVKGSGEKRKKAMALSKQKRIQEQMGKRNSILLDDQCGPYITDRSIIGVDVTEDPLYMSLP